MATARQLTLVAAAAAFGLHGADLAAQETCRLSWDVPVADSTYIQQQPLEVGDVPGHELKLFEASHVFPHDRPNCEGLKRKEERIRSMSDLTDGNGAFTVYSITIFDTGERLFARGNGTTRTTGAAGALRPGMAYDVLTIVGGTGRYRGATGIVRHTVAFDPKKRQTSTHGEAEYLLAK